MTEHVGFKKPPLVEVACGTVFHVPEGFALPHIGSFWGDVKDDFPHASEAPPVFDPLDEFSSLEAPFPLPRTWLHNSGRSALLQIQRDRFIYNWKRGDGSEPYPRFQAVFAEFTRLHSLFCARLKEEGVSPLRFREFELTYANHIPLAGADASDYLVDHRRDDSQPRFLPNPAGYSWSTTYALQDESSRLTVTAQKARAFATGHDILKLDISVKGFREEDMPGWFDMAHQQITSAFVDITRKDAQENVWGRL